MKYRIQAVSEKLQVPKSTIRYWEKEFSDFIKPERTRGGQRRYCEQDIENLHQLKTLLYHRNRTIDETKNILQQGNADAGEIDWKRQSVLVTGGTGFLGRHFCKTMLERYKPHVIRIYSRDELKQHAMRQRFGEDHLRYFIGDVRDMDRLRRAMEGVDIVVHAAALKQIAACEYNPLEAVKTNIHGAQNVIDAAIDAGVKKVIAFSTEKAVNPVNIYGATKLCAEKMFIQGNAYAGSRGTRFSCVRYGNIIGSSDNPVSMFKEQKKTGTITISDRRMTGFWIALDQVIELTIKSLCQMQGGEIFVPKIPSLNIVDIVKAIAPKCTIELNGIKPGEKLHEVLITAEDGRNTVFYDDMYVIRPNYLWWEKDHNMVGQTLPDDFVYASNMNDQCLVPEDFRTLLDGFV